MNYNKNCKVELHVHLDCSLSYEVVKKINPKITKSRYLNEFVGSSCSCLNDYIKCADRAVEIMQSEEELKLVTIDLFDQLKKDNVVYAEIRFAPLLHIKKGLSPNQVVKIVSEITDRESNRTGIEAGLILCTLRHFSKEMSDKTVRLVNDFKGTNVIAFDIAADEAGYPLNNHIEAFKFAKNNNIPCTAHAGEALGAESVIETLDKLSPQRIGHGIRSIEDPILLDRIKENKIHLELCLTSNIVTKVYNNYKEHPIDKLYNNDISISINSDGRAISNTDLNKEYSLLSKYYSWDNKHFLNCNLNAINASFASQKVKDKIISILIK
jgi:adenosine deaminase